MKFTVDGTPQGKARPRFSAKSGTVYTPRKTAAYEAQIRAAYLKAGGKIIPAGRYARVAIDAFFDIPKSYVKGKRLACRYNINRPDKKPDIDNIIKAVLDALNGTAYEDDKQVVAIVAEKYYRDNPGLEIEVEEVNGTTEQQGTEKAACTCGKGTCCGVCRYNEQAE